MKKRVFSLALLAACLCLSAAVFAADWPQFRGPNRNGIAPDTGINKNWAQKPPAKLWQVALSEGGYAGPSVAGGRVFITDHEGSQDIVRCLDLGTGQEVWRFAYADAPKSNYGFARATPTIAGGKVYTVSRLGRVHCLDAQSGANLWTRNFPTDFGGRKPSWGHAASPLVDGGKVILCPGGANAALVALDKNTGETIWTGGGSDAPGYATPVVADILGLRQYVVFTDASLIGVAANSGQLLWRFPWETKHKVNAATPVVGANFIFVTSGYGHGCAMLEVTAQGPRSVWQNREVQAHFSSAVAYNGHLYGTGDPGVLVCLNPATGAALWKQSGFEKGGLCLVDGVLLVMVGNRGDLVMANATPAGYQELGRMRPLGGQSWTGPIVADGKLIVRNKQALACFDLR